MSTYNVEEVRKLAFFEQDLAKAYREDGDYIGASLHYRAAAEVWKELGDMDQYDHCTSLADDLDK